MASTWVAVTPPSSGALNGRSAGGRIRRRPLGRLATADLNPTFARLGTVDGDEIMCGVWFVFADERIAMAGFEHDVARIGPLADRLQGRAGLGSLEVARHRDLRCCGRDRKQKSKQLR